MRGLKPPPPTIRNSSKSEADYGGDLARLEGKAIFVPLALPGRTRG